MKAMYKVDKMYAATAIKSLRKFVIFEFEEGSDISLLLSINLATRSISIYNCSLFIYSEPRETLPTRSKPVSDPISFAYPPLKLEIRARKIHTLLNRVSMTTLRGVYKARKFSFSLFPVDLLLCTSPLPKKGLLRLIMCRGSIL